MDSLSHAATRFAEIAWGPWLLVLLLGGGLYFLVLSRFMPFLRLGEAIDLLRGRHDRKDAGGELTHFQALASALAGTIGMGNIAGVALAIVVGGPGAVFWMWITAVLGIATKFFTGTLAVMYRGQDDLGNVRGGPMYIIDQALPAWCRPLSILFACAGMIGALPLFQANQLTQVLREVVAVPLEMAPTTEAEVLWFNASAGLVIAAITAVVVLGGLQRIARTAALVVPTMTLLYCGSAAVVVALNLPEVPRVLALIVTDAFTGNAAAGGILGAVMAEGIKRGAYSNEAGIGTETLAHGAARTPEPVREGLVAMVGPIIDTLFVCSATAFVILVTDSWQAGAANGVTLTAAAFGAALGPAGYVIVPLCVVAFSVTTILTYSFYGITCFAYLFGARNAIAYNIFFVVSTALAAVVTLEVAIGIIDGCYALMAIPTMTAAIWLAPRVMREAQRYWQQTPESSPVPIPPE